MARDGPPSCIHSKVARGAGTNCGIFAIDGSHDLRNERDTA